MSFATICHKLKDPRLDPRENICGSSKGLETEPTFPTVNLLGVRDPNVQYCTHSPQVTVFPGASEQHEVKPINPKTPRVQVAT